MTECRECWNTGFYKGYGRACSQGCPPGGKKPNYAPMASNVRHLNSLVHNFLLKNPGKLVILIVESYREGCGVRVDLNLSSKQCKIVAHRNELELLDLSTAMVVGFRWMRWNQRNYQEILDYLKTNSVFVHWIQ